MYKPTYEADGTLTATATSGAVLLTVDAGLAAYLDAELDVADWTYLRIEGTADSEAIKVTAVNGNVLTVERAVDGNGPYAFAAFTPVRHFLPQAAVVDILNQEAIAVSITITGTGVANVTEPTAGDFVIDVPVPTLTGSNGIVVTGDYDTGFDIALQADQSNCCANCGGSAGSGDGIQSVVAGAGITTVSSAGGVATVSTPSPAFSGAGGLVVSGAWPNILFTQAPGGSGTVESVGTGTGLSYTGDNTVDPVLYLANTAVTAGNYGGIAIDQQGRITAVPATLNPVSIINGGASLPGLTYARVGDAVTLTPVIADVGVPGIIELADATDPLDELDDTSAVTPALLAAVLGDIDGASVQAYDSYTAELDATYTNVLSATALTLNLVAGESVVVFGSVTMTNTATPTTVPSYALALFNTTPAKLKGNKTMPQCQQHISFVITGPSTDTIRLVTSTVPADTVVQSSSLWAIKL